MIIGYARTSPTDQKAVLHAQVSNLRAAGGRKVFSEQASMVTKRPALTACLESLRAGDALMVAKPGRIARRTAELLAIGADLSRRGIDLIVLSIGDGERLDTRNPTSQLILTVLGGVATWEREILLERQREGIAKAKAEGRYKGRTPTVMCRAEEIRQLHTDGMRLAHIAKRLRIARSSVYRVLGPEGGNQLA